MALFERNDPTKNRPLASEVAAVAATRGGVQEPQPPASGQLSPEEREAFEKYRQVVRKGLGTFVAVGRALKAIKDRELYRETHDSFETFLQDEWGLTLNYARRKIAASDVVGSLVPFGTVPETEAVARPLTKLKTPLVKVVWERVLARVKQTPGEQVTSDLVQSVCHELAPKRQPRRKKVKRGRPVVIRVAGAKIRVEPTRAGELDLARILTDALNEVRQRRMAA